MARSEGKAWLSSHVLSQLMQARVRSSSGFSASEWFPVLGLGCPSREAVASARLVMRRCLSPRHLHPWELM